MKYFITGGAGFIGSNLVDRLIEEGDVTVYDNLSAGRKEFIEKHFGKKNFRFIKADILDFATLQEAIKRHDIVFHFAANSDIRFGVTVSSTDIDLKQGTLATYNVLEAMRLAGIKKIVYPSSSVVYGEPEVFPTPEDYGPLLPISLYGASKLACESLITAFTYTFDMQSWIFRFANVVGKNQTHGVIVDFIEKLNKNPLELEILGDGKQKKSYMLVEECIDAMFFVMKNTTHAVNVYNLGAGDQVSVNRIAEIVVEEMQLKNVQFKYTGTKRGWLGDVTEMLLDVGKLNKLGWKAK
ncbi:MAG: NAD-dependent epimerase/dehydratase family protein, partial [Elusimicrobiota bacterium]|nr:NAD-dependent epimerase/dehydratase family protein [Elusimicrobiota bacterium]